MSVKNSKGSVLVIPVDRDIGGFVRERVPKENVLVRYVQKSRLKDIVLYGTDRWETPKVSMNASCARCVARKEYFTKECYDKIVPEIQRMYDARDEDDDVGDLDVFEHDLLEDLLDESDVCPAARLLRRDPSYTNAVNLSKEVGNCNFDWLVQHANDQGMFILVYDASKMQPHVAWDGADPYAYTPKAGLTFKECLLQVYRIGR